MLQLPRHYLIIDALDECPDRHGRLLSRGKVFEFVKKLVRLQLSNLRLYPLSTMSNRKVA
jgi:hypothetical protein